jgi:RNA polymerase sigma-70 factor (ECF subfamily)
VPHAITFPLIHRHDRIAPAWLIGPWKALNRKPDSRSLIEALSDEACMCRYQRGDDNAFEQLYARYHQRLHRYALRLAPRVVEAEELFQEVWIAVIQSRAQYRPSARFASWRLFAIAHRRAADRWRALARHAPDWQGSPGDNDTDSLLQLANQDAPERDVHNLALGGALLAAIATLPLPQREAFLLKAEGALSLEEIAQITVTTRETVKSRLRYASAKLRAALEPWR